MIVKLSCSMVMVKTIGRFRDDAVDGQGGVLHIPSPVKDATGECWYIPVDISDMPRIHLKAGFGPSINHH